MHGTTLGMYLHSPARGGKTRRLPNRSARRLGFREREAERIAMARSNTIDEPKTPQYAVFHEELLGLIDLQSEVMANWNWLPIEQRVTYEQWLLQCRWLKLQKRQQQITAMQMAQ